MKLPALTSERMRLAYEFLAECPPFAGWNLPAGEDIKFMQCRDADARGWHDIKNGQRRIAISQEHVRDAEMLLMTMAHEMIHVHENETEMMTRAQHSPTFVILARRVCKRYGWNLDDFIWGAL